MNKNIIGGKMDQLKGKVSAEWHKLRGEDFDAAKGDAKALMGKLRETYGWTEEEVKKQSKKLEGFIKDLKDKV